MNRRARLLLGLGGLAIGLPVALASIDHRVMVLGTGRIDASARSPAARASFDVDLGPAHPDDVLPRWVDVAVGDTVRVRTSAGARRRVVVRAVEIEDRRHRCPRTRVDLEVDGAPRAVRCGMAAPDAGGIEPLEDDGLHVAADVTRLLFSRLPRGASPFSTWSAFRLRRDVRLVLWDDDTPFLAPGAGAFPLAPPEWGRNRLGNWGHATSYGLHTAIDLFVADPDRPPRVVSPVDAIVVRTYPGTGDPDDPEHSQAVRLVTRRGVGPAGERVVFRVQHLAAITVADGDTVAAGDPLGVAGHSGFDPAIGDHLHFEMRVPPSCVGLPADDDLFATVPVNPYPFLLAWWAGPAPAPPAEERPS